jgi:transcriptional regulator with XRE-family HTH domain
VLSKNLLSLRKSKGLTQTQIADKLGLNHQTYGRWENGTAWPDTSSIEKLADFYNIRSTNFFYDSDIDKPNMPQLKKVNPKEITRKLQELIDFINN